MVDRDLLLRKLADLDQYVDQVSEYRAVRVEDYRRDWKTQRIVERTLQMAIEACLDVANHVVADRQLRVASTYAEIFDVLGDAGLLEANLREAMIRIARFRNILVHDYARIDPAVVVRILHEGVNFHDPGARPQGTLGRLSPARRRHPSAPSPGSAGSS